MKNGDALQIVAYEEFLKLQPDSIFVTHDSPLKNILEELNLKFIDPIPAKSNQCLNESWKQNELSLKLEYIEKIKRIQKEYES